MGRGSMPEASSHFSRADQAYRPTGLLELASKAHGHGLEPAAQSLVDLKNGHFLTGLGGLALAGVGMRAPGARFMTKELIASTKEYAEFLAAHTGMMDTVQRLLAERALRFGLPGWTTNFISHLELALYDVQHGNVTQMTRALKAALSTLDEYGKAGFAVRDRLIDLIGQISGKGERAVEAATNAAAAKAAAAEAANAAAQKAFENAIRSSR